MRVQRQKRRPSLLTVLLLVAVTALFAATGAPAVEPVISPLADEVTALSPKEERHTSFPEDMNGFEGAAGECTGEALVAEETGNNPALLSSCSTHLPEQIPETVSGKEPDSDQAPETESAQELEPGNNQEESPESNQELEPGNSQEESPQSNQELEPETDQEAGPDSVSAPEPLYVMASFYGVGDGLDGQRTASGEIFNANDFTAAHPTLPFQTRVRVTYLKTGSAVEVRINDRGPTNSSFGIDLSAAAAREIGLFADGVGMVELVILEPH